MGALGGLERVCWAVESERGAGGVMAHIHLSLPPLPPSTTRQKREGEADATVIGFLSAWLSGVEGW